MTSWIRKHYPNGAKVRAAGNDGEMLDGTITAQLVDSIGRIEGIRVHFDEGGWCDYDASWLDEEGKYANSFVEVIG